MYGLIKYNNCNINNKKLKQHTMEPQANQTHHLCILLRISNYYLGLTLAQLALTVSYLLALHNGMIEIASWIQIWLALLIFIDLCIKFLSEKYAFWFNKWNIADIVIFVIVIFSIVITFTHGHIIHHNANNTLGAIIMTIRYILQIYRVIFLLKVSKEIHDQQKYQGMINLKPGVNLDVDVESCEHVEAGH